MSSSLDVLIAKLTQWTRQPWHSPLNCTPVVISVGLLKDSFPVKSQNKEYLAYKNNKRPRHWFHW